MLPRKNRITRKSEYDLIKKAGTLIKTDYLTILFIKKVGQKNPRFGIIVSNKISKRAVQRNKIRRSLRHAIMELSGKISNFDYLIIVRKNLLETDKFEIVNMLESKLKNV